MKKRLFRSGLLFVAVMCLVMSFSAGAWDCETDGHSWSSLARSYEQGDEGHHYATYKCYYCNAEKRERQEHNWTFTYKYEPCNDDCHYALYKCYACNAEKKEQMPHEWFEGSEEYEQYNDDQHYTSYKCDDCKAVKKELETHDWEEEEYEQYDNDQHYVSYKCDDCKAVKKVLETHNYSDEEDEEEGYEQYNNEYHYTLYKCDDCGGIHKELQKHEFISGKCIRKASITQKGIAEQQCDDCNYKVKKTFAWKFAETNSLSYNIIDHTPVYKTSTSITVKLKNPAKGAVLRATIAGKKYETKITNESKKIKVKLKQSKYGSKIKLELLYKGKVIGKDDCDQWDNVLYAKNIKKGMTKNQVKYLYYWGGPDDTASASGGWSYWYYDDGSYIAFKKGKVYAWYNAAG